MRVPAWAGCGLHGTADRSLDVERTAPAPTPPDRRPLVVLAFYRWLSSSTTAPRSGLVQGWRLAVPRSPPRPDRSPATRLRQPPALPARPSSPTTTTERPQIAAKKILIVTPRAINT